MKPHPYRLEPLSPVEAAGWDDLIQGSAGRELFHRRAWLDYLAAALCADIKQWAIRDGATTLGYLCGGIVRTKSPRRRHRFPRPGERPP